ncbi:hypothetical protein An15g06520 [Aspergillus niger]|uniref:Uncharacterized protein n=2 Tax=Aspergillus niger TaxID=5061 RepID=A2R637_ASPNC|nr:hypothetical protein An15g06520 [Aspergillus niger]CAK42604.1 hypothetical protein An15g06520 [Aspergillus niger]
MYPGIRLVPFFPTWWAKDAIKDDRPTVSGKNLSPSRGDQFPHAGRARFLPCSMLNAAIHYSRGVRHACTESRRNNQVIITKEKEKETTEQHAMNEGRAIQPHQPSLPGDGDRKIEIHWARALQRQRANKPTSNNAQLLPRFMICACPDSSFYPSSENGGLHTLIIRAPPNPTDSPLASSPAGP